MHLTHKADEPILTLKNYSISLQTALGQPSCQPIIAGLNVKLSAGEVLGVVGQSGTGKTSLMLSLLGLLPKAFLVHADTAKLQNQPIAITKQGDESAFLGIRGRGIGYIFQEPKAALNPVHTLAKSFDELFHQMAMPKKARKQATLKWLRLVQLPNPEQFLHRYPHELSGGEARRASMALVLAMQPKLIIADEPTGALDASLRDEILDLLVKLCQDSQAALMLISHDLPSIVGRCDWLLAMDKDDKGNHRHEFGKVQTVLTLPIAKRLMAADYGTPSQISPSDVQVLSLQDFGVARRRFWWGKPKPMIDKINLTIYQGEIIGIMGASGIGKTTLAKAITRLDDTLITQGQWLINGSNPVKLTGKASQQAYRQTQLVMQEVRASLNPDLTIFASLLEAFADQQPSDCLEQMHHLLALCGLSTTILERYPDKLSGGECQRVCLVRALLAKPDLLILDEPTAMLDRISIAKFLELLKNINTQHGTSMMIISHDKAVLQAICHRIITVNQSV
ncbi:ABC transporter ATP-binding protein [Moraxella sp. ZJ142]|uniref:ABC transporter ATP-binding protein n=1 Tax=Moraxella marmotae TaxID=3344520 RepID=UPI0035D43142